MPRLVHVTTFARSGGGMQTMVHRHHARDATLGFSPEIAAIFEPADSADRTPPLLAAGLAAAWHWTPRQLRRRFAATVHPRTRDAVVIYHNAWAIPLLAPGDGATRRVSYLHSDWPGLVAAVPDIAAWSDAILCVTDDLAEKVRTAAPSFQPERIEVLPYPVEPPPGFAALSISPRPSPAPKIGVIGRVQREQKRLDRLPALVRAVAQLVPAARWEIIGDGSARAALERAMSPAAAVTFRGWLTGEPYWRALADLDAVVFLSDYEGLPIALLEALSLGVRPLFPAIGGTGERYARVVDPCCVYPAGDTAAAARQLADLLQLSSSDAAPLRTRAIDTVATHTPAAYELAFSSALKSACGRPRLSSDSPTRAVRWSDFLPLAFVRRLFPRALWL